ncbi:MAG: glycosyltransferase family 2 protein [Bacteroidetes bacterium]|nr:glycosyltransferase family 2 protein [Bacteroidota bacterium]
MRVYIVIPAYNEAEFLPLTLMTLAHQTLLPDQVVVVDDNSKDQTFEITQKLAEKWAWLRVLKHDAAQKHVPGAKVIKAFCAGLQTLDDDYDILMKLDADLRLPENYIETIVGHFKKNDNLGMVGGFAAIQKNGDWIVESLTNKDHIRGALKSYRKACFKDIGGLIPAMGWDTLDEMTARYKGWQVRTDENLIVQHLRPTGQSYAKEAHLKQGEAFYQMRYGIVLTFIASLKLASKKKKPLPTFIHYQQGFWQAFRKKTPYLIDENVGKFLRNYRYQQIFNKIGF